MVLRVVSTTILQSSQRAKCLASSCARSGASSPSRNSQRHRITCLQTTTSSFPEVSVQQLASLQARPQQTRFHRRDRKAHHLCRLFGGEILHVAQYKDRAKLGLQPLDRLIQYFSELQLGVTLFGIVRPILYFPTHRALSFGFNRLVQRDGVFVRGPL